MLNKIERSWREPECRFGRQCGTGEERTAGTVVDGLYLRASGEGDVVGQAPGVMYSK